MNKTHNESTIRLGFVFIGLLVVVLFSVHVLLLVCSVFGLPVLRLSEKGEIRGKESNKYRFLHFDGEKYSRGFNSIYERLLYDDFISFQDEKSHTLISNFGSKEYRCSGTCYCDENHDNRRSGFASTPKRLLTYFIAAFSTSVAIQIASSKFDEMCSEQISSKCNSDSITSEVSKCEQIENEDHSYLCHGHCIDKLKYLRKVSSDSIFTADSYEVDDPEEEIFPKNKEEWEDWLEKNHDSEKSVWVWMYKVHTKKKSANFDDLVEGALRYGWIDGGPYRKNEDKSDEVFIVRFTRRRKKGSNWSQTNLKKARKMIRKGEMNPEGLEEYNKWIKNHPNDEDSHCEKFELEKDVEIGKRVVKRLLKTRTLEEAAKEKFAKDLHRFCADLSKREKMRGGNNLVIKCVGHENLFNPSIKCVKTFFK